MDCDALHEMHLIEMFEVLDMIYEAKSAEEIDYLSNK